MYRLDRRVAAGLIALLVSAAAALSPAWLEVQGNAAPPAPQPAPVRAVVRLANGQKFVRMRNGALLLVPVWLTIEPVTDSDEDVAAPGLELAWRGHLSDEGFDRSLFDGARDAAGARQALISQLLQDVEDLSEKYGLTPAQQQKLRLAGRGDIKRVFDRVEDARRRLQAHVIHDDAGMLDLSREMSRELTPLQMSIKTGPLGEGSLFAKTLKGALTAEQIAAYQKWKRDHPVVVTYSWDLRIR
jgi:hypothetical protein